MESTDIVQKPDDPLEEARLLAVAYLPTLITAMTERAIDPACQFSALRDTAEFAYKVSGMAKRQEEKSSGPGFSLVINIPQMAGQESRVIEIGCSEQVGETARQEDEIKKLLSNIPSFVTESKISENIDDITLDFDDFDD